MKWNIKNIHFYTRVNEYFLREIPSDLIKR